jgi:hypothetical protein
VEVLTADEVVEVVAGPAIVLRHHGPGESETPYLRHQLLRSQGTVGASLVGVDVEIKNRTHRLMSSPPRIGRSRDDCRVDIAEFVLGVKGALIAPNVSKNVLL